MKNGILEVHDELKLENSMSTNTSEIKNTQNDINLKSNINSDIERELNNDIDTATNCLALTVRENYQVVAVKNFFKKSFRISWKIALSMFTINFLNMFL